MADVCRRDGAWGGPDLVPDTTLAGYRILEPVGRGGIGVVYRAEEPALGRLVALKVLAPELADHDEFRRRFLPEMRVAASIEHPNILPIYRAGEDRGLLYLAMRYVDASDPRQVLRRLDRAPAARRAARARDPERPLGPGVRRRRAGAAAGGGAVPGLVPVPRPVPGVLTWWWLAFLASMTTRAMAGLLALRVVRMTTDRQEAREARLAGHADSAGRAA